jgi:hypothetical protein
MQFHPYAEDYELLTGTEYADLKADIKSTHGPLEPVKFRFLPDKTKQYLDGRHRIKICQELGLQWSEVEFPVPDEEVEDYIDSLNKFRRHMTKEQRAESREARIARVKAKRDSGKSFAIIAEEEGISKSMAYRDVAAPDITEKQETTVPRGTVDNKDSESKVNGADGRKYKKSTRKLCPACSHRQDVGKPLIDKCEDCKELNAKPRQEKPIPPTVEEEEPDAVLDDAMTIVPARLRAVFQASGLFRSAAIMYAKAAIAGDKVEHTIAYAAVDKACSNAKDGDRRVYSTACRTAEKKMIGWRPALVCQNCAGDGCEGCGNKGYLCVEEVKDGV